MWIFVDIPTNPPTASVSNDGYVYVIGGYNGEVRISSVERYCSRSNRWMSVTSLSQPISRCQATSMSGFIYVAGRWRQAFQVVTSAF